MGSISEDKLDTELSLTRRLRDGKSSEGPVSEISIKPNKVGMVEKVEEFRAELELISLFEAPILGHRKVDILNRLSSNCALAQGTKLTCGRCRESRWIQVLRWIAGIEIERRSSVVR